MNDVTLARRLGRRMDQLLVDRSLFAWTHRVLGVISGCICVVVAIATHRLLFNRSLALWLMRGAGSAAALVFFLAALPFVVSYSSNIELVDEKFTRTALFAFGLVGTSILADAAAVLILRSDYSVLALGTLYCGQAIAYVGWGHLTLGRDPESDICGW
jgi:hypothetical protein